MVPNLEEHHIYTVRKPGLTNVKPLCYTSTYISAQPTITCSPSTVETPKQCRGLFKVNNTDTRATLMTSYFEQTSCTFVSIVDF